MHVPTHILSGWCLGNLIDLTPAQRVCCMVATTAADLDGLGIVVSQEAYWNYHHKLGHNLPFAVVLSAALALATARRTRPLLKTFGVYFFLAHVHLVLDYFGSGPGWPIHYLWPLSTLQIKNPNAWEFNAWQNKLAALAFLLWTIWIAVRQGRTPLERVMPSLDHQLVAWLQSRLAGH